MKEQGDSQYNNERWQDCSQCRDNTSPDSTQLISYKDRDIHCQNARSGLRDSQQIDKVFLCDPFPFGYDFILNKWNHCIASANGEGAYFKKDSK